jgi:type III secretion protein T
MNDFFNYLPTIGLAMVRPIGAMIFIPVFNKAVLGGSLIRNSIILMMAIPMLPFLFSIQIPDPTTQPLDYLFLIFEELVIGVIIGIIFAIPFWAVDIAGFYIDTIRGSSIASIFNPQLGATSSLLGIFFTQLLAYLFFRYGGMNLYLEALHGSYRQIGPGQSWHISKETVEFIFQAWNTMLQAGFKMAMPGVILMVLTDISLGLMNRSAPQINVFSISMSIKSVIVFFIYIICAEFFMIPILNAMKIFNPSIISSMIG